jgi:hypothetical protein
MIPMLIEKRALRQALRLGMKTLISQEVRLLRLERSFTPHVLVDDMSRSIQETKDRIIKLAKGVDRKERAPLLKKMLRETMEGEIDRAIQLRSNKCLRCVHGRFYDEAEMPHVSLPLGTGRVQATGCDRLRPELRKKCRRFVETGMAASLEDYLNEITLLYEFKDVIDRMNRIWEDYLAR